MDVKTVSDYRKIADFINFEGDNTVQLILFLELLEKAEKLHEENQWLYGKLNIISDVIQKGRDELIAK